MQPLAHPFVPTPATPSATATAHIRPPYQGEPENLTQLREFLVANYSLEEVKELCQDFYHLGLDFENLGGEGKNGKCREMVMWFQRRSSLKELAQALGWKSTTQAGGSKYNVSIQGSAQQVSIGDHNTQINGGINVFGGNINARNVISGDLNVTEHHNDPSPFDMGFTNFGGNDVIAGNTNRNPVQPPSPETSFTTPLGMYNGSIRETRDVIINAGSMVNGSVRTTGDVFNSGTINGSVHCRKYRPSGNGTVNGSIRENG